MKYLGPVVEARLKARTQQDGAKKPVGQLRNIDRLLLT